MYNFVSMKTFELRKKEGVESSVYCIALVENPAIEVGFVALSKSNKSITAHPIKLNADKQMIYTPVLIPEQRIYREDENGNPYQIYFSKETIQETAHDYVSAKLVDNFNHEHNEQNVLKGVALVENWLIEDKTNDKSNALGFDLPVGTWMAGIKIDNAEVWAKVKDGTYKGISIEGLFDNYTTKFNNQTMENQKESSIAEKLEAGFAKLSEKIETLFPSKVKFMAVPTVAGAPLYVESALEDGVAVYADEAMTMPAEDGEYELEEGRILSVASGIAAGLREREEDELKKEEMETSKFAEIVEALSKLAEGYESLKAELSELKESQVATSKETEEVKAELSKALEPAGESVAKLGDHVPKGGVFTRALNGESYKLS